MVDPEGFPERCPWEGTVLRPWTARQPARLNSRIGLCEFYAAV